MRLFAPPVREHDGRTSMRSLADALEKLRRDDGLTDDETVEIRAQAFAVPDGGNVAFVAVVLRRSEGAMTVVHMPVSQLLFTAVSTHGERLSYPIQALHEAISDVHGNVSLSDGRFIHSVDLTPSAWPRAFTARDDRIVRHAITYLGKEDKCYGSPYPDVLPDMRLLRYDQVRRLRVKPFAALERYILERMPDTSPGEIKSALRRAGTRFPHARPTPRSRAPQ
jgi:hypothetical protein